MRRRRRPLDHAADGGEPVQILAEEIGIGRFGVQRGERIRDAVLRQIIAGRHLAAEAVAAVGDGHFAGRIGRGLDQHGDVQLGQAQRIGDGALVAEIGQGDDDAVDLRRDACGTDRRSWRASARVSMAPCLVSSGLTATTLMAGLFEAAIISSRPLLRQMVRGRSPGCRR